MNFEQAQAIVDKIELVNSPFMDSFMDYGFVVLESAFWEPGGDLDIGRSDTLELWAIVQDINLRDRETELVLHWPLLNVEDLTESELLESARVLLIEMITHELHEAFTYESKRLFDPHSSKKSNETKRTGNL